MSEDDWTDLNRFTSITIEYKVEGAAAGKRDLLLGTLWRLLLEELELPWLHRPGLLIFSPFSQFFGSPSQIGLMGVDGVNPGKEDQQVRGQLARSCRPLRQPAWGQGRREGHLTSADEGVTGNEVLIQICCC